MYKQNQRSNTTRHSLILNLSVCVRSAVHNQCTTGEIRLLCLYAWSRKLNSLHPDRDDRVLNDEVYVLSLELKAQQPAAYIHCFTFPLHVSLLFSFILLVECQGPLPIKGSLTSVDNSRSSSLDSATES